MAWSELNAGANRTNMPSDLSPTVNRSGCVETINIKQAARRLVDQLPENSTWDDLIHEIYVRQSIEKGLADSEAGRTTSVEEVREKFGLSK
jgi:predicted transcriptional regulator